MLKSIFESIAKVLKGKLNKFGLEEKLSKHSNYISKAKEIWDMIDKDFGISDTVENKLKLKVDKFDQALLAKFPELTQDDVTELRQSIVQDINPDKGAISSQVDTIKQLQEENTSLKNQLNQFQSVDISNIIKDVIVK